MPYAYDIKIDFLRDWSRILSALLNQMGYKVEPGLDSMEVCIKYFNVQRRLVAPIPRKILFSREFRCPDFLQEGLDFVKEKIEKGIDLRPHLSKGILKLDYNDDLLNDWGIHHLHLGTVEDEKGFVNRTGPVLFVRFDKNFAYFINVMEHGSWAKQELIKIIHDNWPESIERYRVPWIEKMEPAVSDNDRKKLRKAHIVTFVEIEKGIIYAPLGMGYASSGASIEVVRTCIHCNNRIALFENTVKEKIVTLIQMMKDQGYKVGSRLHFLLGIESNIVYAFEVNSGVFIKLGPLFER